jgi:MFS family permease
MSATAVASPLSSDALVARRRLLPVLFIAVFMAALDTAVVGPTIPTLRLAFGVDNRAVALVTTVYVLCSLASTALMANLSDRYGRRPIFLMSVSLFALGSSLVAISTNFGVLIAARAVQGLGAGGVTPTASSIIGDVFPAEERGKALGLIGATFGMAFVFGPPLAGGLMLVANWHWIFLINLPIAAVVLWLGQRSLPGRSGAAPLKGAFDLAGISALVVVLVLLVLGITRIADPLLGVTLWPWCLGGAAVALISFLFIERRAERPMIPLTLFKNRQLAVTYTLTTGAGFSMGAVVFLASVATLAHGVDSRRAGFMLLPLVVASMVGAAGGGRLMNRLGPRTLMLVGFFCLALGYLGTGLIGLGFWMFLAASLPVGLGVGIVVGGSLRSIAIEEAPPETRAAAQGVINIGTSIGTLTSAATMSALADFAGGGAEGLSRAYFAVTVLMGVMFGITLLLQPLRRT